MDPNYEAHLDRTCLDAVREAGCPTLFSELRSRLTIASKGDQLFVRSVSGESPAQVIARLRSEARFGIHFGAGAARSGTDTDDSPEVAEIRREMAALGDPLKLSGEQLMRYGDLEEAAKRRTAKAQTPRSAGGVIDPLTMSGVELLDAANQRPDRA